MKECVSIFAVVAASSVLYFFHMADGVVITFLTQSPE